MPTPYKNNCYFSAWPKLVALLPRLIFLSENLPPTKPQLFLYQHVGIHCVIPFQNRISVWNLKFHKSELNKNMRNFLLKRGLKSTTVPRFRKSKFAVPKFRKKNGTWIKKLTENCCGFFTQAELTNHIWLSLKRKNIKRTFCRLKTRI